MVRVRGYIPDLGSIDVLIFDLLGSKFCILFSSFHVSFPQSLHDLWVLFLLF